MKNTVNYRLKENINCFMQIHIYCLFLKKLLVVSLFYKLSEENIYFNVLSLSFISSLI